MTKERLKKSELKKLLCLMPQLKKLVNAVNDNPTTKGMLEVTTALVSAAESIHLSAFTEIATACVSALSFFQENGLELESQIIDILADCLTVIVKQAESELNGTPFEEYHSEQNRVLTALSVFVAESTGFELQYCEDVIAEEGSVNAETDYLKSILASEDSATSADTNPASNISKTTIANKDVSVNKVTNTKVSKQVKVANLGAANKSPTAKINLDETTRVKSLLLEQLMSHSEELVQIRNALADIAEQSEEQRISELYHRLATVSDNILNDLLKTRMRPIGILLNKYKRIVRDLAKDLDKNIGLKIIGENIELDGNVIDAITEPLTHLVRNSVDHGIEMPADRVKAGKSPDGLLTIHAYNEAGKVVIKICDDGKGVDSKKVLATAIKNGLVSEADAASMSKNEILELIFVAGLSTAKNVTAVSGRGVGMDAVKRKVEEIKGIIELKSDVGIGTEVHLRFPLTMATLKVSLFKIYGTSYALPSSEIKQIVRLSKKEQQSSVRFDKGLPMLHRNNSIIPLIEPKDYMDGVHSDHTIKENYLAGKVINIVVFHYHGRVWGLVVDDVFAFLDIVIKPMDQRMNPAGIFAGVAVLGSGELALVMSPEGVLNQVSATAEEAGKIRQIGWP